ncbi:MAG: PAAR domain-containing protein [Polyangiaceae bacterium]|nr:PAAR domain-containing protein [Polyangiaceae bacterium]
MPPAARITDMHTCPMVNPGPVPHVGGPEISGSPNVITGFMPQGRVGDSLICVPAIDKIAAGSPTVLVNNMQAARLGDPTVHGGRIVAGCPTVIIGDTGQGSTFTGASANGTPFCEECEKAKQKAIQELGEAPVANVPPPGSANTITQAGKKILEDLKEELDKVLPPEKRQELEKLVKVIKPVAEQLLAKGEDEQSVASWAVAARKAISAAYDVKLDSYADVAVFVYDRNKEKFGDALGPGVEWLMSEKGKTAREIIEAAATGNLEGKISELKGDIVGQLADEIGLDPRIKELAKGAVMGNFEEKLREVGGGMAKDIVTDVTGNETIGELADAAINQKLPDKVGEIAGAQVEKFMGKLAGDEKTAKTLSPITNYLKGKVSEQVTEKLNELIAGGGA